MRKTGILLLLAVYLLFSFTTSPVHAEISSPVLPEIEAESYILINAADNRVICEKNPDLKLYPASTTKIMTAILAIEAGYYDQTTTVSRAAVQRIGINGSNAGLKEGEILQYKDLIRMTLISSANDAANALAEGVSGSMENFVVLMNSKAKELGLENTNFTNPAGLDVEDGYPEHKTTARELAQIMRYATSNPIFRQIIGETEYELPVTNFHPVSRGIRKSTDLLLINPKYQSELFTVVGGKTGYTKAASNVFVACARNNEGVELILAIMKHPNRTGMFEDAYRLFEYGFEMVRLDSSLGAVDFYDLRYINNADVIYEFYEKGYIGQIDEGRFGYGESVTRGEFLQVLGRIKGNAAAASGGQALTSLDEAVGEGILDESWRGTGGFPATRGDAIKMLGSHVVSKLDLVEMFALMIKIKDLQTVPVSSLKDVLKLCKSEIIMVREDGTIGFDEPLTREEMVVILDRYIRYRDNALKGILSLVGHIKPIRRAVQSYMGK